MQQSPISAPLADAVVIASAGSGKTMVAANRVTYLLAKHGYEPRNVAALSFSVSAAHNLLDRITRTIEDKIEGPVYGLPELFSGTMHSFAMHSLKAHVSRLRKFEVLGEAERRLFVRRRFRQLCVGRIPRLKTRGKSGKDAASEFLTIAPEDVALFLSTIDRVRDECLPDEALPPDLLRSMRAYESVLEQAASWDYAGLIQTFVRALTDAEDADCLALQNNIRERLRVLIVDEAQDLDRAMWCVLTRLRELGVTLWFIGDHHQTIYRWRSADPEAFLSFSQRAAARSFRLSHNFRSTSGVVGLANGFCRAFLRAGDHEPMRSATHHNHEQGDIAAVRFTTQDEQYRWVAQRLKTMLGTVWQDEPDGPPRGLSQSDMTVLVRTRKQMTDVSAALRAEGLNVVTTGTEGLLVSPEAQALATAADFLGGGTATWDRKQRRLVIAPVAEGDVRDAIRAAFPEISDVAAEQGIQWLMSLPMSPNWEQPVCIIEMLETWLQHMGVQFRGNGGGAEEARWLAIRRILDAAVAYQRWGFASPLCEKIRGFARWLRVEAGAVLKDERSDDGLRLTPDAVTVQTCHAAKGLEYAVVAVVDLADGSFPARPRSSNLWQVVDKARLSQEQQRRLDGTYSDKMRDEANLFYVTVTRSAKYLFLTYAPPERGGRRVSPFFSFVERHRAVVTDSTLLPINARPEAERLPPTPRAHAGTLQVTATELQSFWTCPRLFHLRHELRLPPPLNQNIGFGRSLHDAAWACHQAALEGKAMTTEQIRETARRHLNVPFAGATVRERLEKAAIKALQSYVEAYSVGRGRVVAAEQEVRLDLDGVRFVGRVDLAHEDAEGVIRSLFWTPPLCFGGVRCSPRKRPHVRIHQAAPPRLYRRVQGRGRPVAADGHEDSGGTVPRA